MLTEFAGRTAVVTGAASGIGLGIARRCADRGMSVAMLDVEAGALSEASSAVANARQVLALTVDVSDAEAMEAAAEEVASRLGGVHLLCNNAGVSVTGPIWTLTDDDCRWLTGVNLFGVMNGIRAFVPRMLEGGDDGHVVNTASLAGLTPMPEAGLYSGTKAAVVAMSEVLLFELQDAGARIGVSVLCPGLVNTNIFRSERNRPAAFSETNERPALDDAVYAFFATGEDPLNVADRVFRAVEHGDFYVLTNEAGRPDIAARMDAIAQLGEPVRPQPGAAMADPVPSEGSS